MKKLLIYLGIIILLFAVIYFVNNQREQVSTRGLEEPAQRLYQTDPADLNPATRAQLEDPNYQNIILEPELNEKLQNGESLFVYFFSPTCEFCVASTPIVNDITQEENVVIRQMNVLEDRNAFTRYGFDATPTMIYFENGEEKDRFVGGISGNSERQDAFREFIVNNRS